MWCLRCSFGQELQVHSTHKHTEVEGTIFNMCPLPLQIQQDDISVHRLSWRDRRSRNVAWFYWFWLNRPSGFAGLWFKDDSAQVDTPRRRRNSRESEKSTEKQGEIQWKMRHYLPFEGFHHLLEGVDRDVVQLNKPTVANLPVEQNIT